MEWKTETIPSTVSNKLIVILSCENEEGDLIEVGELILTKKEWKYFNRVMDEGTKAVENYPSERKTWERMGKNGKEKRNIRIK